MDSIAPVLIVEDDSNDILLVKRALDKWKLGVPVRFFSRGEEALEYLTGQGEFANRLRYPLPSLVLSDLKLPRVSGLDILRCIRERPELASIPVIVLSSSSERADIKRAYDLGVSSYLVKPTGFDALAEMMRCILTFWVLHNQVPRP